MEIKMNSMTAKDFLIQKCDNSPETWKGTKNLTVNDWMGLMEQYAQHVCEDKKNNIEERQKYFTDCVLVINCDNHILLPSLVLNTNGKSFIEYWAEHGENDRKMRFEKQASFDIKRRLLTWKNNNYNNAKPTYTDKISEYLNR